MSDISQMAILRQEHDLAVDLMNRLRDVAAPLASGAANAQALASARDTLARLRPALLLHFRVEEEGLYPDVQQTVAADAPRVDILSAFFGDESDDDLKAHTLLRARVQEIAGTLDRAREGHLGAEAASRLHAAIELAHGLLTRHAHKETTLIFPMIERLLDRSHMAAAEERMRTVREAARCQHTGA